MQARAPKLPLWNQLMENPTASTSLRVNDLDNGEFLISSPLN
ncbi:hypothetical protein [Ruegeria arenilitoris]|nr:hypothetical protein [Ruegeria arenilitoris]